MLRAAIGLTLLALLAACSDDEIKGNAPASDPPPPATPSQPARLQCDDSLKTAFRPDANTTVTLVKFFKQGEALALSGTPASPAPPAAASDVCLVKLNVGPGNPGPADAPSTAAGIGLEIWLPTAAKWNKRIHALGGGGWAGGTAISSLTVIGSLNAASVAASEGAVSGVTDTGHTVTSGAFAMNPDGSINTRLWTDFASRGIHELALKTKALAAGFYGEPQRFAYWNGCSTGGRQGHMLAQAHPADFDGILAGAPAFNWTKFITAELYPQLAQQLDLGFVPLTPGQLNLASSAAVSACETNLHGGRDGYDSDPSRCNYDPTRDASVLCTAAGGTNATADCLTFAQANVINKIWYGQTVDGSVPSPAVDNGYAIHPLGAQLWFGLTRGTNLLGLANSSAGTPLPFTIATDQVALNLQDPRIATPAFLNASGNGQNRWRNLSFSGLADAFKQGVALQTVFANINTDNPDLTAFRDRGGKLLMYHGTADQLIPVQGSLNYYNRAATVTGGIASTQNFYHFFLVPGMGHCSGVGSVNGRAGVSPPANPPLPAAGQLYAALTDWVEKGVAPSTIPVTTPDGTISRPLCLYPKKLTYLSGSTASAASFTCQ